MASPGRIFHGPLPGIDQAPIAADGAFELALPRLVIGLDQIDAKTFALGEIENLRDHAGLVGARRQRALAHPPRTRPAGFADQDFLARKCHRHPLADRIDMGGGEFRAHRDVFPIRQDMNRDEIDGVIDLAVAQPVFPDVGVGDGNRHLRLDRADVGRKIGRRHLAAQQHLVADHQCGDRAGIFLGERNRHRNLCEVLDPVAREPDALDHLQPDLGGECGDLVEPVLDRIGADAVGDLGELRQILRDLFGVNMRGRNQRRLRVAERRIGHALQLGVGIDRGARKRDRRGEPPPHGCDHA